MKARTIKHLSKTAPSHAISQTACGAAGKDQRIVDTLAAFILKGDNYFACWRCRQTSVYTSLGGTAAMY